MSAPYKINIHTVAARFIGEHHEPVLHSFDDFLETCGAPMDADGDDELELFDDRAWLKPTGEPFHYRLNQVFAEFKDRRGNISFHSLMGIHEGGLPACEEDDDLLELNSEQVFVMEHDGSFVVLLGPGEEP